MREEAATNRDQVAVEHAMTRAELQSRMIQLEADRKTISRQLVSIRSNAEKKAVVVVIPPPAKRKKVLGIF